MTIEGITLIPMISAGFGFGAGGGSGKGEAKQKGEGSGGGTGGGAWVKPVAVIIISKDGVKVEPIMGSMASAMERIGETIPRMMEKLAEKWVKQKKEG